MRNQIPLVALAVLLTGFTLPATAEMPDGIYVRIDALDHPMRGGGMAQWAPKDHDAQDILKMIRELRPDVLDRFMNGSQNPNMLVPVKPGSPKMTVVEFLNACAKAGTPGCRIVPKIHLNRVWPEKYRQSASRNLLSLKVNPPITAVSFDGYFSDKNEVPRARCRERLQAFQKMGWQDLGFNFSGGKKATFGLASFAYVIPNDQWKPAFLSVLKQEDVKTRLVHFDYPGQIERFRELSPDRQAHIIDDLSRTQWKRNYRFVYPILYSGYDATKQVTSKKGPYKGATVYAVIKQLIERDRKK
jgi:hypothetical protein